MIHYDPRFTMEENWEICLAALRECQERGLLVNPIAVFNADRLIGWKLDGWQPPPGKILYTAEPPEENLDFQI